ncbi:MAG: hypothetical protein CBD92_001850 [Pelagibacteraceae bacterium TMED232]|nr:MAG: hypothetical protein CBD92_001850 [Pelagibacteraceae bacterium TMED232]|tara:strand:- start:10837 stop:11547 length:711 start_codon:yes stop_codon:yes gene_type:complete
MEVINKTKSISIWIFIVPFVAVNTCLILITQFQSLFPNQEDIIHNTIPYFDGGASISRTARPYPSWLVFKPAMFLTSYLLVRYWIFNKEIINLFNKNNKNIKKIIFFGIGSAIALTIHSIFLGIKFDNDLYKLFRRVIMLVFIIFEITAQAYLVATFLSLKEKLSNYINLKILKLKFLLVSLLIIIAVVSIPIISLPGDSFLGFNLKFFKHALEWDYFIGVITFYLLTFFMWKKTN